MSRFALSLQVFLWSGLAFAESAPLDMLLSSSLARQFGQPAELGSESEARLQEFIGKTMESVSCGPRACAEWEADGADLFMALAAVRALESRGKGGIQLEARTTWLASALYLSLEGAREPPRGAGERFPEEKKWSLAVAKERGEKVLGSVPAHVETLRALAWAERARGDQQGPFGARLEAREADGMITWGEAKAKEEYTAHFDRLMAALKGGDPDGALDALDWMSGWLAGTPEGDFLRAISALLEREPFDVFQALRRMEGRKTPASPSLRYQGATVGLLVAQRARLKRQEKGFLKQLASAGKEALNCADRAVFETRWKLPCLGFVAPEIVREQLKDEEEPAEEPSAPSAEESP